MLSEHLLEAGWDFVLFWVRERWMLSIRCHLNGRGWLEPCSVGAEGGDVHAYHKQMVVINLGSRESDAGNNLPGLSAQMTWVWFCRVEETQSPFCICLCYVIEIKSVIYL